MEVLVLNRTTVNADVADMDVVIELLVLDDLMEANRGYWREMK